MIRAVIKAGFGMNMLHPAGYDAQLWTAAQRIVSCAAKATNTFTNMEQY